MLAGLILGLASIQMLATRGEVNGVLAAPRPAPEEEVERKTGPIGPDKGARATPPDSDGPTTEVVPITREDRFVRIRVLDSKTGLGIPLARVLVQSGISHGQELTLTGSDGCARLEMASLERLGVGDVWVEALGYTAHYLRSWDLRSVTDVTVDLDPCATLRVLVASSVGEPIEGAHVSLRFPQGIGGELPMGDQAQGEFNGTLELKVELDGFGRSRGPGPAWSSTWTGFTDFRGEYVIRDFPSRTSVQVSIAAPRANAVRSHPVFAQPGEVIEVSAEFPEPTKVQGRAIDANTQAPLAGCTVNAYPLFGEDRLGEFTYRFSSNDPHYSAVADSQGIFEFDDLRGSIWYMSVRSDDPDGSMTGLSRAAYRVDANATTGILLRVERGLFVGGLTLIDGKPCPGVAVSVMSMGDGSSLCAVSKADGSFLVGPLAMGEHVLSAQGGGGAPPPDFKVSIGDLGVVIEMLQVDPLLVRLLDKRGKPHKIGVAHISQGGTLLCVAKSPQESRGDPFRVPGMPPGNLNAFVVSADCELVGLGRNLLRGEVHDLPATIPARLSLSFHDDGEAVVSLHRDGVVMYLDRLPSTFLVPSGDVEIELQRNGSVAAISVVGVEGAMDYSILPSMFE